MLKQLKNMVKYLKLGKKIKEIAYIWKVVLKQLVCSKWPLDDLSRACFLMASY